MEVAEVSRTKFDPYVIGNNIRDLREKRKMTQMKAAEEMDMSLCHYARIEEGSKGMSIQMLFRFINFYKTDANTILMLILSVEEKMVSMSMLVLLNTLVLSFIRN